MAAPVGNKFWKARSKHGPDRIFSSPHELLIAAYEYFEWNAKNPWYKKELIRSGELAGQLVDIPLERPLSDKGLCSFIGVNTEYLRQFEKKVEAEGDQDTVRVIAHIREMIDRQQLEGAKLGVYNANIVARELGLKEHTDLTTKGEKLPQSPIINIHPVALADAPPIAESEDDNA